MLNYYYVNVFQGRFTARVAMANSLAPKVMDMAVVLVLLPILGKLAEHIE